MGVQPALQPARTLGPTLHAGPLLGQLRAVLCLASGLERREQELVQCRPIDARGARSSYRLRGGLRLAKLHLERGQPERQRATLARPQLRERQPGLQELAHVCAAQVLVVEREQSIEGLSIRWIQLQDLPQPDLGLVTISRSARAVETKCSQPEQRAAALVSIFRQLGERAQRAGLLNHRAGARVQVRDDSELVRAERRLLLRLLQLLDRAVRRIQVVCLNAGALNQERRAGGGLFRLLE